MQRFRKLKNNNLITDINITPLVDITLVLLIIFMVTATYIARLAIPLELPKAGSAEQMEDSLLAVTLGQENKLYLNGQEARDRDLEQAVENFQKDNKKIRVLISADRRVSFERFVNVLDRLQILGVIHHAINTVPFDQDELIEDDNQNRDSKEDNKVKE